MMRRKMLINFLALLVVIIGCAIFIGWWSLYKPDLLVSDVTSTEANPSVNNTEVIKAEIQNAGKATAKGFDVCLLDNGAPITSKAIDKLDKGKTVNVDFTYTLLSSGHHTLEIQIDCKNHIREANEENNKAKIELDVKEAPPQITATVFKRQLGNNWHPTNYGGSSPVIHNGKIYVGGKNEYFFCLNKETGEEIWKYKVENAGMHPGTYSTPVFYKNNVYFGSTGSSFTESGGYVFSLNTENGKLVWKYETGSDIFSITLDNGEIYALDSNGVIYRIDALTGKLIKTYKMPERTNFASSIVIYKGKIYAIGDIPKTRLYCIDTETGSILWTFDGEKYKFSIPVIYHDKVYLDGRYCLDANKGFVIWENKEVSRGSQAFDKDLFVATVDGKFLCINAANGQTIWKQTIEPSVTSPFISNKKIYIGTTVNKVYCIDEHSGDTIAIYKTNGVITTRPLAYNGKVYVVADDGYLYCFEEK